MTTDLEKQFFDTFGIKQIEYTQCTTIGCKHIYGDCNNCQFHNVYKVDYPQITDSILIELICILSRWHLDRREPYEIMSINKEQLKNQILSNSLYIAKFYKAKQQVQELFRENI